MTAGHLTREYVQSLWDLAVAHKNTHSSFPELCKLALDQDAKLAAIESLARQYNSPAVNPGAHELAGKLLRLLEERT